MKRQAIGGTNEKAHEAETAQQQKQGRRWVQGKI